jgi:hypothetical protein
MLVTVAMAERARALESRHPPELDEPTLVANLTDVLVGVLHARLVLQPARSTSAPDATSPG